jgi:hypothetical protein
MRTTNAKTGARPLSRALIAGVALVAALSAAEYWWLNGPPAGHKPDGSADYWPVGKYAECRYSLDILAPGLGAKSGELVWRHVGSEQIGGRTYQTYVEVASGIPMPQRTHYYRSADDGIYTKRDRAGPEWRELALPLRIGTTWTYTHPDEGHIECRAETEETAELMDARYERSIRVSCKSAGGMTATTYYAPGFGTVKETAEKESVTVTFALKKCQ